MKSRYRIIFLLALILLGTACLHSRSDIKVPPTTFVTEFWRNVGWQRYEALPVFVDPDHQQELRKWLGPRKKPDQRITHSNVEQLKMASPSTAEIAVTITYFNESEYVERVTEVNQTWHRKGDRWILIGGFPLEKLTNE